MINDKIINEIDSCYTNAINTIRDISIDGNYRKLPALVIIVMMIIMTIVIAVIPISVTPLGIVTDVR